MTYAAKLKDPRWQKKRLQIMERDNFTCHLCNDTETTLHVHHKEYLKGKEPWDYEDENFQTLCFVCHKVAGVYNDKFKVISVVKRKLPDGLSYIVNAATIVEEHLISVLMLDYYIEGDELIYRSPVTDKSLAIINKLYSEAEIILKSY